MAYSEMEEIDAAKNDRPRGTVKHPFIAWLLASARMTVHSLRHPGKAMQVDYSTGDVWTYRE